MPEIRYLGFTCRVVSLEWAALFGSERYELALGVEDRMNGFVRALEEIRELPEA